MTGLRVVRAQGPPRDRGRQVGSALGDLIERSLAFYQRYLGRRGVTSKQLEELLTPYLVSAEEELPACTEVIKGMAEGAMVPVWELFAVNAFEELEPLLAQDPARLSFLRRDAGHSARPGSSGGRDRCSSFVVNGPGYTLLGHNELWVAGDAGNVAVVIDQPDDGAPAVASPTIVCCLPAVGMNELGGAQGIQSLVAADDGVGVPRVLVSRHTLDSADRVDAVRRAGLDGRAGGYGYVFAFRGGDTFLVETTAARQSLLSGPGPHTNHYLDPALGQIGPQPSAGSLARYERLLDLIEERRPDSPKAIMEILSDHESHPQSICQHADELHGEEAEAVLFSVVCDLEAGGMWVSPGNPCSTEYEEIDLAGTMGAARAQGA